MHTVKCGPRDNMHRKHLQEIPDQSSNVITSFTWGLDSSKMSEVLSGMGVSALDTDDMDSENIPQELLSNLSHMQSPARKRFKSQGNDKDFVIRRPKQNRENVPGISWDAIPDELLLEIFSSLCLTDLLNVSTVCKRWYHLACDESLWQTLDLAGRNLSSYAIVHMLSRGVIAFRCPRSVMDQPLFEHFSSFRIQHMDLSYSTINTFTLHCILRPCSQLQNLSLEGLPLSEAIVRDLAQNTNLTRLNLCGCSGFSSDSLMVLLRACPRLDELNLSWCLNFTERHLHVAVENVSGTLTQLNLSGYRSNLPTSAICVLTRRCPKLTHLDLSDSVMLTNKCFEEFLRLKNLQHLSLSRCYEIVPETLFQLIKISTLKTLQVFGIVRGVTLKMLKEILPDLKINDDHLTTIARPTTDNKTHEAMWGIKCRLTLPKPQ